ncbi:MAG: GNAT family N-acetyltransferase [Pseudomonadota bacterium]
MAQVKKPELRTERLILRAARPDDVADRLALGNSPAIQEMFGMDTAQVRPLTQAAAEAWVEAQMKEPWGWVMEHDGRCIGSIRLHQINWADKRGYLALGILDETKLSMGLGSEAMDEVVRFALGPLGLHRLTVRALAFNERAIAAYEKVGFRREGRERQSALIGEAWHDDVMLGLIAPDLERPRVSARRVATRRLTLRPFRESDVEAMIAILNDIDVSRWVVSVPHPFTAADVRMFDDEGNPRWPRQMAVIHEGRIIGTVSAQGHLGFLFARDVWGQGFATEAAAGALAHVFGVQGCEEITSGYFAGNEASRRVLTKLGFVPDGTSEKTSRATGKKHVSHDVILTRAAWEAACSP